MDSRVVDQLKLRAIDLAVYVVLCRHADNKTQRCFIAYPTIANLIGLSAPTVMRSVKRLVELGLIAVQRRSSARGTISNEYTLRALPGSNSALPRGVSEVEGGSKGGLREQDSINKTQENKRECGEPASPVAAPSQPGRKTVSTSEPGLRDPNLDHPTVVAYRTMCGVTANRTQRAEIAATVSDLPRWQEVIRKWLLAGYNPKNIAGMLDWYHKGIPERSYGNDRHGKAGGLGWQGAKAGERYGGGRVGTADERARFEAEWDAAPTGGDVPGAGGGSMSGVQG
jgi:DNA-binding Lrp family transcriptional regulator